MYTVFIHIGMPKTASTSMQKLLYDYQDIISENFFIPKSCQLSTGLINHGNIFFEMSKDIRFDPTKGNFNDLLNEIKDVKKNIILTAEDFSYLLTNNKHKKYFEQSIEKLNYNIQYLCFFRNEVSYFFSVLKELKAQKIKQAPPHNIFRHIHDIIHFKNALLYGYVSDDYYQKDQKYRTYFNIVKFKKIIEKNSLFKFKYYKYDRHALINFGKLFGINNFQNENYQLNKSHKNNLKNFFYKIPGFIIYLLYKNTIREDIPEYLL